MIKEYELTTADLRYKNLVERNGVIWEVNDIIGASGLVIMLPKEGYESLGKRAVQEFKPIPLTSECMEEIGLEMQMFGTIKTDAYKKGLLTIHIISGNTGECQVAIFDRLFPIYIRFVHQLQNLYFALTGKELTIKQNEI